MFRSTSFQVLFVFLLPIHSAFPYPSQSTSQKNNVIREGFHFQLSFGGGRGPSSMGLWHNMEIGGTFQQSGITLGYTHVFLLSATAFRGAADPDMFGGHMFLLKMPIYTPQIIAKVAIGFGESVDLRKGFVPYFGFGWHYGIDFHIPVEKHSGFTISISGVHALTAQHGHHVGFGLSLGYTWF